MPDEQPVLSRYAMSEFGELESVEDGDLCDYTEAMQVIKDLRQEGDGLRAHLRIVIALLAR